MSQHIEAVFEDGVFRPQEPVNIANGERVSLNVESRSTTTDDPGDLRDLLDVEFMEACRQEAGRAASLEEVRKILSVFEGSLADRISEERDDR